MAKALTISAMVVAILVVLLFAMDLAIGFPFNRANSVMDVTFSLSGSILAYLCWSTYRDIV